MSRSRSRWIRASLITAVMLGAAAARAAAADSVTLFVEAEQAPRKIFHARLAVPAGPGPLTLLYPKWIPGEHGPTGPITDLAGLKISAGGLILAWSRDPVDMYAIHCDVPEGSRTVEVELDYLSPAVTEGFSSGASASAQVALVSWNQLLLYPKGSKPDEMIYAARMHLPRGWKYGTALPVVKDSDGTVEFAPVTLTTLVDSPVLMGANFRVVPLGDDGGIIHQVDIAADSAAALEMTPEWTAALKNLVAETGALFGARHYRGYQFLLTLSDHVAHFGLEHHESSDDRVEERTLVDPEPRLLHSGLLPHEFVHSWNGKYRRPADLAPGSFDQPMHGDLLWVYEGLTQYLGHILTARSGLNTPDQYRESLALIAAALDHRAGRSWRPLEDTAVAAQLLYFASDAWEAWRRSVDYYDEGDLIWLEADVLIRQQTRGTRSLDDFCRKFHGAPGGPPAVRTYTFDDVVSTLNDVLPYDWRTFLRSRLDSTSSRAPLGGVESAGWRLVYTDVLPDRLKADEKIHKTADLLNSLGVKLKEDTGEVVDAIPGMPADKAGIGPGMRLVAVNGRKFSKDVVRDALRAEKGSSSPLELLVENGEYFRTYLLDYHGGERYPHLERDPNRPDLLSQIIQPAASRGR